MLTNILKNPKFLLLKDLVLQTVQFTARYADSTIHKWIKDANKNGNKIESRGSGNFSSDEAKEIARLRKKLKDTQDALEVLKKAIGILGK